MFTSGTRGEDYSTAFNDQPVWETVMMNFLLTNRFSDIQYRASITSRLFSELHLNVENQEKKNSGNEENIEKWSLFNPSSRTCANTFSALRLTHTFQLFNELFHKYCCVKDEKRHITETAHNERDMETDDKRHILSV